MLVRAVPRPAVKNRPTALVAEKTATLMTMTTRVASTSRVRTRTTALGVLKKKLPPARLAQMLSRNRKSRPPPQFPPRQRTDSNRSRGTPVARLLLRGGLPAPRGRSRTGWAARCRAWRPSTRATSGSPRARTAAAALLSPSSVARFRTSPPALARVIGPRGTLRPAHLPPAPPPRRYRRHRARTRAPRLLVVMEGKVTFRITVTSRKGSVRKSFRDAVGLLRKDSSRIRESGIEGPLPRSGVEIANGISVSERLCL
jgi:hypothetical protein